MVGVFNPATNSTVVRFFSDVDLNSSNIIMTALLSDLGLSAGSKMRFAVFAFDNNYTGVLTDAIPAALGAMSYKLDAPAFFATEVPALGVPVNSSSIITVNKNTPGLIESPSQTGLLLMYRDAKSGREADAITVIP